MKTIRHAKCKTQKLTKNVAPFANNVKKIENLIRIRTKQIENKIDFFFG